MLIYITGRGLSGSTILDIALSQSVGVSGMGEFVIGMYKKGKCSCGSRLVECDKWRGLFSEESKIKKSDFEYLKNESKVTKFLKYFLVKEEKFNKRAKKYLDINSTVLNIKRNLCDSDIIVDSSKEVTRGLILSRGCEECVIIHLIRDPFKVVSSMIYHFEQGKGFRFMRKKFKNKNATFIYLLVATYGWLIGNLLIELTGIYSRNKKIKIRYEDLCDLPNEEIEKIEKGIKYDLFGTKKFLQENIAAKNIHTVRGNPTKRKTNLLFDKNRAIGRDRLTFFQRTVIRIIVAPLRMAYGYGF